MNRKGTQRSINRTYEQLGDVLNYMEGQVLDAKRSEVKNQLESMLEIISNNPEFKEGIDKLSDEAHVEYDKILTQLFFRLTMGQNSEFQFGNTLDRPVFRSRREAHAQQGGD